MPTRSPGCRRAARTPARSTARAGWLPRSTCVGPRGGQTLRSASRDSGILPHQGMSTEGELEKHETDGDPSDSERRDGPRVPIELKVEYKKLNSFFADYTKNISKGGTFIK